MLLLSIIHQKLVLFINNKSFENATLKGFEFVVKQKNT